MRSYRAHGCAEISFHASFAQKHCDFPEGIDRHEFFTPLQKPEPTVCVSVKLPFVVSCFAGANLTVKTPRAQTGQSSGIDAENKKKF